MAGDRPGGQLGREQVVRAVVEEQPGGGDSDPDCRVPDPGVRGNGTGLAVAGDAHARGGQQAKGRPASAPCRLQQQAVAGGDHAADEERDDDRGSDEGADEPQRADLAGAEVRNQHHGQDDEGEDQDAGVHLGTPWVRCGYVLHRGNGRPSAALRPRLDTGSSRGWRTPSPPGRCAVVTAAGRQPAALPHHRAQPEIVVADDQVGVQARAQGADAVAEAEYAGRGGARRRGHLGDRQARGDRAPDDVGHGGGRAGDGARRPAFDCPPAVAPARRATPPATFTRIEPSR